MVDAPSWSRLAKLVTKHNKVQAIIDTAYMSTRFYFTGPPRGDDEQQAEQDLCYIRVAAEGASTREQGLLVERSRSECFLVPLLQYMDGYL